MAPSFSERQPYRHTPAGQALRAFLTEPGDHESTRRRLRADLEAEAGSKLRSRNDKAQRMAWTQVYRTERSVGIAVLAHLATRHFIAAQVDRLADPAWGTPTSDPEELAAYEAAKTPGHDIFLPGLLRDAQLPISCMFHSAGQAVTVGLRRGTGDYARFAWVADWISASAAALAGYSVEYSRARRGDLERAADGGVKFQELVNSNRAFFAAEAEDPYSHGLPFIATNLDQVSHSLASWVLANPELSPEASAEAVLRDLRHVVMPAGHVLRKIASLPLPPLDIERVVVPNLGRVIELPDHCRQYVDKDLRAPSPAGERQCSGHRLGPSGGLADSATVDRYYRAISEMVSPYGVDVEVGDTPSPDTSRRDRTFLRPTEISAAAFTLAAYRNGVFPALAQTARQTERQQRSS